MSARDDVSKRGQTHINPVLTSMDRTQSHIGTLAYLHRVNPVRAGKRLLDKPSRSLFEDFCDDLSSRLEHDWTQGFVKDISLEKLDMTQLEQRENETQKERRLRVFKVAVDETRGDDYGAMEEGKRNKQSFIFAKHVILAIGRPGTPTVPCAFETLRNQHHPSLLHTEDMVSSVSSSRDSFSNEWGGVESAGEKKGGGNEGETEHIHKPTCAADCAGLDEQDRRDLRERREEGKEEKEGSLKRNRMIGTGSKDSIRQTRALVIGGGLSAAQMALRLLNMRVLKGSGDRQRVGKPCFDKVVMCSRRPLTTMEFDLPPSWLNWREMERHRFEFYALPTMKDRFSALQKMSRGSIPRDYIHALYQRLSAGSGERKRGKQRRKRKRHWNKRGEKGGNPRRWGARREDDRLSLCVDKGMDGWNVRLSSCPSLSPLSLASLSASSSSALPPSSCIEVNGEQFDVVVLATGLKQKSPPTSKGEVGKGVLGKVGLMEERDGDNSHRGVTDIYPPSLSLFQKLRNRFPVETVSGFPVIDEELSWPLPLPPTSPVSSSRRRSSSHGSRSTQFSSSFSSFSALSSLALSSDEESEDEEEEEAEEKRETQKETEKDPKEHAEHKDEEKEGEVMEGQQPQPQLLVMGAMAALQLGPGALNLMGARRGAIICRSRLFESFRKEREIETE